MADAGLEARPDYLGRLHLRLSGAAFDASKPDERLSDEHLSELYHDVGGEFIRSKYQGNKGIDPLPKIDMNSGLPLESTVYTSGIPIFGRDDAKKRAGWSIGHTESRTKTSGILKGSASEHYSASFKAWYVSAENSHALGHGDYGTDHLLSAPPASKAQNTEQLAIELGMRAAAQHLNAQDDNLDEEHSLVHAKITDILHPASGRLMARRIRLIRRAHAADTHGTVVFDHLMDGNRLHISRDEAFALGQHAHDSLMNGVAADHSHSIDGQHKSLGGVAAPTASELYGHQKTVLEQLQSQRAEHFGQAADMDRSNISMVGPAFTSAIFPSQGDNGEMAQRILHGEDALTNMRERVIQHRILTDVDAGDPEEIRKRYYTSGSVPADADTKLLNAVTKIKKFCREAFKTETPTRQQIEGLQGSPSLLALMEAHAGVNLNDVNYRLLSRADTKTLGYIENLRKRTSN